MRGAAFTQVAENQEVDRPHVYQKTFREMSVSLRSVTGMLDTLLEMSDLP